MRLRVTILEMQNNAITTESPFTQPSSTRGKMVAQPGGGGRKWRKGTHSRDWETSADAGYNFRIEPLGKEDGLEVGVSGKGQNQGQLLF